MDRENEPILSGIGACPYCGQAVAVDRREGETPADAAARVCDCIGARQAREDARRRENARALIEELFGERCREAYGLEPVTPDAQALLVAAADRIIEGGRLLGGGGRDGHLQGDAPDGRERQHPGQAPAGARHRADGGTLI